MRRNKKKQPYYVQVNQYLDMSNWLHLKLQYECFALREKLKSDQASSKDFEQVMELYIKGDPLITDYDHERTYYIRAMGVTDISDIIKLESCAIRKRNDSAFESFNPQEVYAPKNDIFLKRKDFEACGLPENTIDQYIKHFETNYSGLMQYYDKIPHPLTVIGAFKDNIPSDELSYVINLVNADKLIA